MVFWKNKQAIWVFQLLKALLFNAYSIITFVFVTWMLLFDEQNVFVQYRLYKRLQKLKADHAYYMASIEKVKMEQAYEDNDELLEKLAREKYYMKRDKEDLYIIVKE